SLDAVMFVVVSGITRPDKISSSNLLDSLETDYNFLVMTAQIVDVNGTILWEYPNFRQKVLSYSPLLNLQYPDFDEAKANMNPRVQLKFKTLEGKRRLDLLRRETAEVEIYMSQFEAMTSLMSIDKEKKSAAPPVAAENKNDREIKK
ncbi:MAG: hypothetical protein J0653_01715, partial [Deltaproteobacteria bacterium]|nr:hypothetical protein [Deltaproteobacteria bacterium]